MSLFTWGLGVLSVILLGLIVLFSNKKVIAETKLEQADNLLNDIAKAQKQARENAKTVNAMSDAELNDSLRRKKNK